MPEPDAGMFTLDREATVRYRDGIYAVMAGLPAEVPNGGWTDEHLFMDLPAKWELSFGCLQSGRLAGFVIASARADRFHIHYFAVSHLVRGQGIGGRLVRESVRRAVAHGLARVSLKVYARNTLGIRFYLGQGFSETAESAAAGNEFLSLEKHAESTG